jgi:hypothetical protein
MHIHAACADLDVPMQLLQTCSMCPWLHTSCCWMQEVIKAVRARGLEAVIITNGEHECYSAVQCHLHSPVHNQDFEVARLG